MFKESWQSTLKVTHTTNKQKTIELNEKNKQINKPNESKLFE